ncbi:MAG: universal stress protein [Pseudonocardiaceae bacterium]|nr:universal stress protein [Pseudonocardiaceae bacterium]
MGAYQTVMAGTDGSETSLRAVDRAAEVARDSGATLVLVCAYFPYSSAEVQEMQDDMGDAAYQVVGSAPAEQTLHTAHDRAATQGARDIKTVALEGKAVEILVHAVDEHRADLLVVGDRGLNTLTGRLLGSVPSGVARNARCDVLIARTKA